MKKPMIAELPGYLTVAGAADRLLLAPRSVRDLIYTGRLPSARLGRRHLLRIPDVEAERRRRLGLPLLGPRPAARPGRRTDRRSEARPVGGETRSAERASSPANSESRRQRAEQRAAQLDHWLRSGHGPATPRLPFTTVDLGAESASCDACRRTVRGRGRMVDAEAADGHPAARLCLTCARRTLLAWSDHRRREAVAARRFAEELGSAYPPRHEPAGAAA